MGELTVNGETKTVPSVNGRAQAELVIENVRLAHYQHAQEFCDLCHGLDATRPTTMAYVFMLETDSPLIEIADIRQQSP